MQATLVEVGPRDGLQNETQSIPTDIKLELIHKLSACGLSRIEAGSFVSPGKIPQLSDSDTVFKSLNKKSVVTYSALVPNEQGMQRALAAQVKEIAVFTSASNTFNQKNIHCDIKQSIERIATIMPIAKANNIPVRGYISCVVACPYEGNIAVTHVTHVAKQLLQLGCFELSLGDTIGVATPNQIRTLLHALLQDMPAEKLALHCHNTYGTALANITAALDCGLTIFDSTIAGLGGCPYAKGATGNVATEDVLYLLEGMGYETGVDLTKLIEVGQWISSYLNRETGSAVSRARANT